MVIYPLGQCFSIARVAAWVGTLDCVQTKDSRFGANSCVDLPETADTELLRILSESCMNFKSNPVAIAKTGRR